MEHLGELAQKAIPPILDTTRDSTVRSTIQCARKVDYRAARIEDSAEIARYICKADGGLYEFLFNDLVPFMTAAEFLAAGVAREEYPISYRNCFIAFDRRTTVCLASPMLSGEPPQNGELSVRAS